MLLPVYMLQLVVCGVTSHKRDAVAVVPKSREAVNPDGILHLLQRHNTDVTNFIHTAALMLLLKLSCLQMPVISAQHVMHQSSRWQP